MDATAREPQTPLVMRFPRGWICVLGFAAMPAAVATVAAEPEPVVELRLKQGDDPRWAASDWDDHAWERIRPDEFPARAGVYWVRFRLARPEHQVTAEPEYSYVWPSDQPGAPIDSVFIGSIYSFDMFWDGRLLARSGVVGASRAAEVVGPLDHLIRIPDDLLGPGEHLVAFRISSYHYNFSAALFGQGFMMDSYARRLAYEARRPVFPLVGVGGSLLMAVISAGLFYFIERRRPLLLCSLLGLALAGFYGLIAFRWLYRQPYDWHCPRLVAITAVMTIIGGLLPWLLMEQFAVPRRRWWLAGLVPVLLVPWLVSPVFEVKALWLSRSMLAVSLAIAGWAVWHRRPGARFVLAGVVIGLIAVKTDRRIFLDPSFFLVLGTLVLFVFTALGAQVQADRRRAQQVTLTAARLEIELLKKNLQPHFLLNTLTAISEVIEQDPPGAVQLIDDLAAEFRSLALMSGERLVPLRRELDLCRSHLKVINRRTGRNHELVVEGAEESALVPPALFLTLIENGLVHQQADAGAAFRLVAQPAESGMRYIFTSPGYPRDLPARPVGGTGLRYVKARLEESFPGKWTLTQSAADGGWETVIGWRIEASAGGIG